MLAMLGRAKGRSDESQDLVRPVASILCTLVSDICQPPLDLGVIAECTSTT